MPVPCRVADCAQAKWRGCGNWECRGRGARGRERSWEPLGLVVGRSAGFCVWPRRAGCVIFLIPFDLPSCAACGLRRGA